MSAYVFFETEPDPYPGGCFHKWEPGEVWDAVSKRWRPMSECRICGEQEVEDADHTHT